MMANYSGPLAVDHGFVTDNEFVTRKTATEGHKVLALVGRAGRRCGNDGVASGASCRLPEPDGGDRADARPHADR